MSGYSLPKASLNLHCDKNVMIEMFLSIKNENQFSSAGFLKVMCLSII